MTNKDPDGQFVSEITAAQPKMRAYIAKLMSHSSATDDVLQESNRVLWEKRDDWQTDTIFLKWAYRVCYFQVKAWRRDQGREKLMFNDELLDQFAAEYPNQADQSSRETALKHCLGLLPVDQQETIIKRYDSEFSVSEIAQEQNISPNTLSQKLRRIRMQLQTCIEKNLSNPKEGFQS